MVRATSRRCRLLLAALLAAGGRADADAAAGAGGMDGDGAGGTAAIEGTVTQPGRIPDPRRSPYADCHYTVRLRPPPGSRRETVVVVLPAFRQRRLLPEAGLREGERIRVTVRPLEDMPEEFRGVQVAGACEDPARPVFAGLRVERIAGFSGAPDALVPRKPRPVVVVRPAPAFAEERVARGAQVAADLARIERLRTGHAGWQEWFDELAPVRAALQRRLAEAPGGFLRRGNAVFRYGEESLGLRLSDEDPRYRSILDSLESMRVQFEQLGTDLIVVMIPMRDHVYASRFVDPMPRDGVLSPFWLKFQHDLLRRNVETIDLQPALEAAIDTHPHLFVPHLADIHPGRDGARIASEAIAGRLRRYRFSAARRTYAVRTAGYRVPAVVARLFPGDDALVCDQVIDADGSLAAADPRSEVLMVGDSMLTAPRWAAPGSSLGVHVMRLAGFPFTFVRQDAAAPVMPALLAGRTDPAFLSGRRVCIFVMACSYLTVRGRDWSAAPFADIGLARAGSAGGMEEFRLPLFATLSGTNLHRLVVAPPADVSDGLATLALHPVGTARRIELPRCLSEAGAPVRATLSVCSASSSSWRVVRGGEATGDIAVPAGCSRLGFDVPGTSRGWSGFLIPAGAPSASVARADVRWAGGCPSAESDMDEDMRPVARYNSTADFARLAVVPPGRIEPGPRLRLDPVPVERTIEVPDPPSAGRSASRRLLVETEAEGAVRIELNPGGGGPQALTAPDLPARLAFPLVNGGPIRLTIPPNSPRLSVRQIELQAP